ncbi:unnamed protein product, partial [Pleuronectes platessa]
MLPLCATQVSPAELQDVFQETSSNIFQINANVVTLEKNLQALGTSRDTAELRQSLHSTQQQTNKVITSTSQLIKQLSDIISGSSRQDRLRLTRLKTELSESVQSYGDLQKKIAERSRDLAPSNTEMTSRSDLMGEGPVFGEAAGSEGRALAFLSEISEEDVEVLHQREEAVLQIEGLSYPTLTFQTEWHQLQLEYLTSFKKVEVADLLRPRLGGADFFWAVSRLRLWPGMLLRAGDRSRWMLLEGGGRCCWLKGWGEWLLNIIIIIIIVE